ncbi:1-deoxy-D-xylulose-5-phosphate reductoisomerase [Motilimonas cestriensis]|uniref:1-deoxy-D-xylulose 5-phosphate reductoisomerase n=1 Tax=Motilimonas cestriensis TaxID=2742685 RepID=A0ABS8WDT3_9GAMM|nr:1-deoxy-D-xylulose-5-phosphate reductoisomerase [Motilimonas cestriensis]MCE2595505.1 1-deoxy-D-xylulose-5-phosphate reductoisomerase [Motilimonas cestriensis]
MKKLAILGATGSIGSSTLAVYAENIETMSLTLLSAWRNVDKMVDLCREHHVSYAFMSCPDANAKLQQLLEQDATQVLVDQTEFEACIASVEVDAVMAAIVGAAGLAPTLAAVNAGKQVFLANKEALVMSGALFMDAAQRSGAQVLPVDSEHNAIFQCLPPECQASIGHCDLKKSGISQLILTGSGGPFLTTPISEFKHLTPAQAVKHPNWSMGPKISVDSATMMNKGLEYIEAKRLFNTEKSDIQVLIHPQSVIHSMVQYIDGSVLAQMGLPDMRTPIAHVMQFPQRIQSGVAPLDFTQISQLTFAAPDFDRYPCLKLAIDACYAGQGATTLLNAANEVAVEAFLQQKIRFDQIASIAAEVLSKCGDQHATSIEQVMFLDGLARHTALTLVATNVRQA